MLRKLRKKIKGQSTAEYAILIALVVAINKNLKKIPGMFQNMVEFLIESIYNLTDSVAAERTKKNLSLFYDIFSFCTYFQLERTFTDTNKYWVL